jgi:hypothetical protein
MLSSTLSTSVGFIVINCIFFAASAVCVPGSTEGTHTITISSRNPDGHQNLRTHRGEALVVSQTAAK